MRKARVSAGFDMVVLGMNDVVSAGIVKFRLWDIATADDMAKRAGTSLAESGTFLDIGANIGYYTLLFAHKGFNVIAVEAMTRNRQAIMGSLCLNPHLRSRVTLVPTALAAPSEVDSATCIIKSTNSKINIGNGHLSCGPDKKCDSGDANCQPVELKTLDSVLADLSPASVDVMKMDVEEHECQVLAGGDSLFSKYHPKLLQVETQFGDARNCLHNKALQYGYREKQMGPDTALVLDVAEHAGQFSEGTTLAPVLASTLKPLGSTIYERTSSDGGCVPPGMNKARVSAGFDMVVLGMNDIVSSQIARFGQWKIATADDMAKRAGTSLAESGTFLDIGANIGYYTLLFAHKGFNVIAVEAMTRNRQAIMGSLCLNPHLRSRVTLVPTALAAPFEVDFATCIIKSTNSKINIGNGHLSCGPDKKCDSGDANCQPVELKTLDSVLADLSPASVDVMKMNVEEHECQVLAGGDSLFSKYHPKLLQVETQFGDARNCLHNKALQYGYREKQMGPDTALVLDVAEHAGQFSEGTTLAPVLASTLKPLGSTIYERTSSDGGCVPPGMNKARVSAGFDMVVLGMNDIVSSQIARFGQWEIATADDLAKRAGTSLAESGTFLDIGANIGYYTLLFAHKGFNVIAVEAMTRNRQAIMGSLCLNPHLRPWVTLVPTALAAPSEVDSATCIIKSTNSKINIGNGHLSCGPDKKCDSGDANCQPVELKTLDNVLADLSPASVDVMKMDVEEHECQVLAGGDSLFSNYHPKLLQVETQFGDARNCLHNKALQYGYREKQMGPDTALVLDVAEHAGQFSEGTTLAPVLASTLKPLGSTIYERTSSDGGCVPPGMNKARVSAGFDMVVLGMNDIVSSQIARFGQWEIATADDMAKRAGTSLAESGTFLDIGANIGYYTLLFAHKGFNVIAVEAMTRNRQAIMGSLCLNPHLRSRVTLVPTALAAPFEVDFATCIIKSTNSKINIGNGHLSCGPDKKCDSGDANCQPVELKTLDSVLADLSPASVDVMKMDVEEHECQVLAGGDSLFSKYHPKLLQVETQFGDARNCLHNKALQYGYREKQMGPDTALVLDVAEHAGQFSEGTTLAPVLASTLKPLGSTIYERTSSDGGCVPPGMNKARVSAGFDMVVLGRNDIVSSQIARFGQWEIATADDLAKRAGTSLAERGTIGANIGYYTLLFAHKGFNVIAVEAMTRNRQAIMGSLCLNPHLRSRVALVPTAVVAPWELQKTCVESGQDDVSSWHLRCDGADCEFGKSCREVRVSTLDTILLNMFLPQPLSVAKIDVGGRECQVLEAGDGLFESQVLQIATPTTETKKCVLTHAIKHGFRATKVGGATSLVADTSLKGLIDTNQKTDNIFPVLSSHSLNECVPPGMNKARVSAGFDMVVLGMNDIVSSEIARFGQWEIATADDMAKRAGTSLAESGTFLDIGANIGYYTLLFAHKGFNVIAVEAMTRNRQAIMGSLCLNPHLRSRVALVPTALAAPSEVDSATCIIKSTNSKINIGNGHLSCGPDKKCDSGDANCQPVELKTLDSVFADLSPASVDVMKMDVEEHECQVLAGGDSLFSKYHPKLLQVETQFGDARNCLHNKALQYGYREKPLGADTALVNDSGG